MTKWLNSNVLRNRQSIEVGINALIETILEVGDSIRNIGFTLMQSTCSEDHETAVAFCACRFPLVPLCQEHARKHSRDSSSFHFTLPLSAARVIVSREVFLKATPWLHQLNENCDLLRKKFQLLVNGEDQIEACYQALIQTASEIITKLRQEFSVKKERFRDEIEKAISETCNHALEEYVPASVLAQLLWYNTPTQISPLQLFSFQANFHQEQIASAFQISLKFIPGLQNLDMEKCVSPLTDQIEMLTKQLASQEENQVKALSQLLEDVKAQCAGGQHELQEPVPDYSTEQSRAALQKFGPYLDQDDELVLVKRGPVINEAGVYIGQWNYRNQFHGYGKHMWKNGDTYEGQWRSGKISGKGRYIWANGDVYVGDFAQNKKEGFGTQYHANGDEYSGAWMSGKMQGVGSYKYGECSQASGDRYIGEFVDGKRNGIGSRFFANCRMCAGSWKSGKRHGKGVMVWPSGEMYFGDWEDDFRTGTGSNLFPNGDVYRGKWKDNMMSGWGELTHPGVVETGTWVDGHLHLEGS